jgi:EmrB/QacA subfamily drug resistance transporter
MRKTHRPLTVVALILSLFMGALEATVVSTAMPTVIGDLGGIQIYSWVFTAYLLTSTVSVPIYGKLADIYGRKPVLLFGIALFLVGSLASGLSSSMAQLIAFRAVQGLGAGSMQPIAITVVGDIFSLEERGKMQGLFGAAWAVAGLIGPMTGGVIVHYLSWHWIFFINIPFGIAAAILLVVALHESIEKKSHVLDIAGAVLLTACVTALLAATSSASLPVTLGGLAASAVLFVAFVVVEKRAVEPMLPIDIFKKPIIAVSSVVGALIGGSMFASMTYLPLFVQGVLGGSPTEAGTAVTPMVIGWPLASAISGRLILKMGYRPLIRGGLAITAAAAIGLAIFARRTGSIWELRGAMTLFGLGLGFANTALLIAVQTSVAWAQRGVVTASTMFVRTMGGALAIGVLGGVLRGALARDPSIPAEAADQLLGPERGANLAPEMMRHLGAVLEAGLVTSFWIASGIASAAFFVSLLFPRVALKDADPAAAAPPEPGPA